MKTQTLLADSSNYTRGRTESVKYIVIHYTANNGDTARGNCNYFATGGRNASAHYFVDESSVYQSVLDSNTAWSVGAKRYIHNDCRNKNSISVEMCSRKDASGRYYIKSDTVLNTIELVKFLMCMYSVPIENVLRHYDVTGKNCPEPFVRDLSSWVSFKDKLCAKKEDEEMIEKFNTINEVPNYAKATIEKLINKGAFADVNKLNLSEDMLRVFVINDRLGIYK